MASFNSFGSSYTSFATLTPETAPAAEKVRRHPKYYLNGGDTHFLVENYIFRVHRYFFERESAVFREKLGIPPAPGQNPKGSTDSNPIPLDDVREEDFSRFLWVFYNPKYSIYDANVDEWSSILKLSYEWRFPEVKRLASRYLEKYEIDPIQKIELYQLYEIDKRLLIPSYIALVNRQEPLSITEGRRLSLETALMIATARECARGRPLDSGKHSPTVASVNKESMVEIIREVFGLGHTTPTSPNLGPISEGSGPSSFAATPLSPSKIVTAPTKSHRERDGPMSPTPKSKKHLPPIDDLTTAPLTGHSPTKPVPPAAPPYLNNLFQPPTPPGTIKQSASSSSGPKDDKKEKDVADAPSTPAVTSAAPNNAAAKPGQSVTTPRPPLPPALDIPGKQQQAQQQETKARKPAMEPRTQTPMVDHHSRPQTPSSATVKRTNSHLDPPPPSPMVARGLVGSALSWLKGSARGEEAATNELLQQQRTRKDSYEKRGYHTDITVTNTAGGAGAAGHEFNDSASEIAGSVSDKNLMKAKPAQAKTIEAVRDNEKTASIKADAAPPQPPAPVASAVAEQSKTDVGKGKGKTADPAPDVPLAATQQSQTNVGKGKDNAPIAPATAEQSQTSVGKGKGKIAVPTPEVPAASTQQSQTNVGKGKAPASTPDVPAAPPTQQSRTNAGKGKGKGKTVAEVKEMDVPSIDVQAATPAAVAETDDPMDATAPKAETKAAPSSSASKAETETNPVVADTKPVVGKTPTKPEPPAPTSQTSEPEPQEPAADDAWAYDSAPEDNAAEPETQEPAHEEPVSSSEGSDIFKDAVVVPPASDSEDDDKPLATLNAKKPAAEVKPPASEQKSARPQKSATSAPAKTEEPASTPPVPATSKKTEQAASTPPVPAAKTDKAASAIPAKKTDQSTPAATSAPPPSTEDKQKSAAATSAPPPPSKTPAETVPATTSAPPPPPPPPSKDVKAAPSEAPASTKMADNTASATTSAPPPPPSKDNKVAAPAAASSTQEKAETKPAAADAQPADSTNVTVAAIPEEAKEPVADPATQKEEVPVTSSEEADAAAPNVPPKAAESAETKDTAEPVVTASETKADDAATDSKPDDALKESKPDEAAKGSEPDEPADGPRAETKDAAGDDKTTEAKKPELHVETAPGPSADDQEVASGIPTHMQDADVEGAQTTESEGAGSRPASPSVSKNTPAGGPGKSKNKKKKKAPKGGNQPS